LYTWSRIREEEGCITPLARLNGVNINYQVEGQVGPPAMIMGFTASRSGCMPQISFFKKYYRVITFDKVLPPKYNGKAEPLKEHC